jgi:hypothetical protein
MSTLAILHSLRKRAITSELPTIRMDDEKRLIGQVREGRQLGVVMVVLRVRLRQTDSPSCKQRGLSSLPSTTHSPQR